MTNNCSKLMLLMWMHWTVYRRGCCCAVWEFVFPLIWLLILLILRAGFYQGTTKQVIYEPFSANDTTFMNYVNKFKMAYSPKSEYTDKIVEYITEKSTDLNLTFTYFNNSKDLTKAFDGNFDYWCAIQFDDALKDISGNTELPSNLNVILRFKSEFEVDKRYSLDDWKTNSLYPQEFERSNVDQYKNRGFLYMQHLITLALVNNFTYAEEDFVILMNEFPQPTHASDEFDSGLGIVSIIFCLFLSFLLHIANTITAIMHEKQNQLKESMKVMGLPGWLYWLSWFLRSYIILLIITVICVYWVKGKILSSKPPIIRNSNGFLFFIFLQLFVCSIITFSFFITTMFTNTTMANMFGVFIYFLSLMIYGKTINLSLSKVLSSSLLPGVAFCSGLHIIVLQEIEKNGLQWNSIWNTVHPESKLTLGHIIIMLVLDTILYMLISLYIEAVFPGSFGIGKPWYFPVSRAFWCVKKTGTVEDEPTSKNEGNTFEEFKENRRKGIQLQNLSKTFGSNEVVKNVTLDMYEGHITVLLGHNGAGKTTTMSMITGMFSPTKGTAIVSGYDVRTSIGRVRDSMGLCLQHNVLFDKLTVGEHIYLFCKLKGLKKKEIQAEIKRYLEILDLEDKKNVYSTKLSGGMKRKLSVAIALCGNSNVVMLDEPTAGMDPTARRTVWNLLQKQKEGRTILLTTHFMDEADLLGDRLAIMTAGELQCCGSSFFLKKRYGLGYYLIMDITPNCATNNVTSLLKQYVPQIQIYSCIGTELTYQLPESDSSKFEKMLSNLEKEMKNLGIRSYGISPTTLEEVFLKVGADKTQQAQQQTAVNIENNDNRKDYLKGCFLITNQILAMILKRFFSMLRTWFYFIFQVFFPILFLLFILINTPKDREFPPLQLTLNSYSNPVTLIAGNKNNQLYTHYKSMVTGEIKEVADINKGFLKLAEKDDLQNIRENYIVGVSFNENITTAWFNGHLHHSSPLSLSLALNALYKNKCGSEKSLIFINHPLPLSLDAKIQLNENTGDASSVKIYIEIILAFIMSGFVLFYIKERCSKCKHLQFICGMSPLIFWVISFLYDLMIYLTILVGMLISLVIFQMDGLKTTPDIGRFTLVLVYFGFFALSFIYLCSYFTCRPAVGFVIIAIFGIITGSILGFFLSISKALLSEKKLDVIGDAIEWICVLVSPFYTLSNSLSNINQRNRMYCTKGTLDPEDFCKMGIEFCCSIDLDYYSLKPSGIGRYIIVSFSVFLLLLAIFIINDYGFFKYITNKICARKKKELVNEDLDNDVKEENEKITSTSVEDLCNEYCVVIRDLTKYYMCYKRPAVNRICLGVKPSECFGLLGVNGAGKTTTFKMITGDEYISYGNAWINGLSVKTQLRKVYNHIGYCPQFDALLSNLTVEETLRIFALIRGVPSENCKDLINEIMQEFSLDIHAKKTVEQLSGGNQRKLSTALALIGDPPVIYLDEPTTGMDPATKRHIWTILGNLRDKGKCLIMTSHSMEECEALCTRIVIMVNGSFKCLGSVQRLKNKFAQGYTVIIKVKKRQGEVSEEDITAIDNFIHKQYPKAQLKERFQALVTYQIEDMSIPWSQVFGMLEKNKTQLNIDDYSVAQCSLEDVFLSFTRHQK